MSLPRIKNISGDDLNLYELEDQNGIKKEYTLRRRARIDPESTPIDERFNAWPEAIEENERKPYCGYTERGACIKAYAAAFPLTGLKLYGPLAAGTHVVEVHGANWFNINATHTCGETTGAMTTEGNAVTVVTKSAPAGFYAVTYPTILRVKPNAEYTISVLLTIENTQGNTMRGDIRIGDNDGALIKFLTGETQDGTYRKSTTFTAPSNGRIKISLRYHNTGALALAAGVKITWAEIMLSEGTLAYEPYQGKQYTVTVDQRLQAEESVEVKNVSTVDGTNIILNSSGTQMEATFPGAITELRNRSSVTPEAINAVPITRKINGKPLSDDITLAAADIQDASGASLTQILPRVYTLPLKNGWSAVGSDQPLKLCAFGKTAVMYGTLHMPEDLGNDFLIATLPSEVTMKNGFAVGTFSVADGTGKVASIGIRKDGTVRLETAGFNTRTVGFLLAVFDVN